MSTSPLRQVIENTRAVHASGGLPVIVFDLDSTLFSTRPRNLRIVREFAATRPEDRALAAVAEALVPDDFGWGIDQPLRAKGYSDDAVLTDLGAFWFARFFTDEYVQTDDPHPGAVAFVQAVHEAGAFVYYLTGRDVHGMGQGTVAALTAHDFPYWRGRTTLHLKPTFEQPDKPYKAEAIEDIRSMHGTVVATFENEPGNANLFLHAFPDATHFLLETEHSPEAEAPDPLLVRVPDFRT